MEELNDTFTQQYFLASQSFNNQDQLNDLILQKTISEIRSSVSFFLIFLVAFLGIYIYLSVAYSKIGKKAKLNNSGIAWMPFFGPIVVIFETAKAHWWPFLTTVAGSILGFALFFISSLNENLEIIKRIMSIGLIIILLSFIFLFIMTVVWHWKAYKNINKPGWWALFYLLIFFVSIPTLFFGIISMCGLIAHLICIGLAAWSKK